MDKNYIPPFTLTEEITNLVIDITEILRSVDKENNISKNPTLRKENRIKSIHSSLLIEANSLSYDQVTGIIEGKRVVGPKNDIQEVKNAFEAYESLTTLNPNKIEDLLITHRKMMKDLMKDNGMFRTGNVGVFSGEELIHAGSPAKIVPTLVQQLLEWTNNSKLHPLIKSCIFHYEFEFIHPFSDGNGRMGRLWHTLILSKWNELFLWIPIESLIHQNQSEYYDSIAHSTGSTDCEPFVTFMLKIIKQSLELQANNNDESLEFNILKIIKINNHITTSQLSNELNVSQRQVQRIIKNLKNENKIERVGTLRDGYWNVLI